LELFVVKPLSPTILATSSQPHILLVEFQLRSTFLSSSLPTFTVFVVPLSTLFILNQFLSTDLNTLAQDGQSEPTSMIAPVGCSIHRTGCGFHPPLHPALSNILPQSIFLPTNL
jgi:hypothetical protein